MPQFKKVTPSDIQYFSSILGVQRVLYDNDTLKACASDHTEDFEFLPELVLCVEHTKEISEILKYCNQQQIAVTARGAGTGLSGGALPIYGGIVLDMKHMNQILHIDEENFQVTVQPGVITQVLQDAVATKGLFYPPDPASKGSCFIGGNIAENSGGPRAVKYGVVKDYVLNLEIVLADGTIMWTGANVLKNASGYNLTQLIVGSEGTLAIVSQIVLRLIPAVKHQVLMLTAFKSAQEACKAVNQIFLAGICPSALEFMERDALLCAMQYYPNTSLHIKDSTQAHLLIELDGASMELLYQEAEQINNLLQKFDIDEILFADTENQKNELWKLRRVVGEAVKSTSIYKEEDTVVPRAKLPQLLNVIKETGKLYGFKSICYGHAGDGNLHVNIVKGTMSDQDWKEKLPIGIAQIFKEVVKMGGTLSGEHGIGYVQKTYMPIAFSTAQLQLMKDIKNIFDPKGILNPGKIFEE